MIKTCFILLTMYSSGFPVGINADQIIEFYDTDRSFSLVVHKGSTRVREDTSEIFKKIENCYK